MTLKHTACIYHNTVFKKVEMPLLLLSQISDCIIQISPSKDSNADGLPVIAPLRTKTKELKHETQNDDWKRKKKDLRHVHFPPRNDLKN